VPLSGTQALVRLLLMQRRRDARAGIETAGFVSGYRGSPLGGLDRELWRARDQLDRHHIRFVPGVNEDLAATAVWGSQQTGLFPGARHDGVFGMWYGKGPGADRSGDAFKHANNAGTAANGGVLAVAGDDHVCRSSTLPHQSEFAFVDAMIPVLNPAGVQEILDLGLAGWALSRFSGLWVGLIAVAETVEQTACVDVDPGRVALVVPNDYAPPPGGLNIRWPDAPLDQEARLHRHKLDAARAFVRANRLDRIVADGPRARLGVVAAGKSYLDVLQALEMLGLDLAHAGEIGLRLYKPAMTWPLEPEGLGAFADGLEEIVVVEEKRALIEPQIKDALYARPDGARPRVIGKRDEAGAPLFSSEGELAPATIARALGPRLARLVPGDARAARIESRLADLARIERGRAAIVPSIERKPHFCSGCPHNTSTRVPEGSHALAGIGCHYMVLWMDRETRTFTQMGGEGANWIGLSPFIDMPHVFQNIGDGTYFHSGLLAIRAAIGAKANMTYKILYNDAVAMTGGQPVDGPLSVARMTHELYGEGVARIAIVADDPAKYPAHARLAPGVRVHKRAALDRVQREMRAVPGVTVIIYDQACATETRRKRKRGLVPDPARRVFINAEVCEGCGDCGLVSNCLSLLPIETEFGRKRAIDQSACNKDFSCLDGLCPSFVTVEGGRLRKPPSARDATAAPMPPAPPEPALPALDAPYGIVATGVGGTGVVTLGALLGLAAHIEDKGVTVFDMTGLAQKYGAVTSHLRIARAAGDIHAARIASGGARLVLGCDLVVAGSAATLAVCDPEATIAVVNDRETPTGDFARDPDFAVPGAALREAIARATREAAFIDATGLATRLMGDAIAANLLLLGHAWQKGLVPIGRAAIERAIEAGGVAVEANKRAFAWGRLAAHDLAAVERLAGDDDAARAMSERDLDAILARRIDELTASRNAVQARRYADLVARAREVEAARVPGHDALARAVARSYYKLLAYKDEYEVARLFADGRFRREIEARFEGDYRLRFHLAPPLFARTDPATGRPVKKTYGPWMMGAFRLLARLKGLRGTVLDPFARTDERRAERRLIADYEAAVEEILAALDEDNHALAVEIAALPERVRGFGPIKAKAIETAKAREAALLAAFRDTRRDRSAAE